jgi:hypothetical protein
MTGGLDMVVEAAIPRLQGRSGLVQLLASDLQAMNLLSSGGFGVMMTAQGLGERRTTAMGRDFLSFIAAPDRA